MFKPRHHNPVHIMIMLMAVVALISAYQDPVLRLMLPHWPFAAEAVGGYTATDNITEGSFAPNTGMALDAVHHRLFVSEQVKNRVLEYDLDSTNAPLDTTPDHVLGQANMTDTGHGTSSTTLWGPIGLSYDSTNDRLYVADSSNNRVLVYNTASIADGDAAQYVIGQLDFDSQVAATTDTGLSEPWAVSIEPLNGILVIADSGNSRVLSYAYGTPSSTPTANRVFGQPNFTTSTPGTTASKMRNPKGILAETNNDRIWVADTHNNRVLGFDFNGASADPALVVIGQSSMTASASGDTAATMDHPIGVAIIETDTADQRLFVTDSFNNRVLVFNSGDTITTGEPAIDVYGQANLTSKVDSSALSGMSDPYAVDFDEGDGSYQTLFVADTDNSRIVMFTTTLSSTTVGRHHDASQTSTFSPTRITINNDAQSADSHMTTVTAYGDAGSLFTGAVTVLLSNDPGFSEYQTFSYTKAESGFGQWPKNIPWDLCFGSPPGLCTGGNKTVYARFIVTP